MGTEETVQGSLVSASPHIKGFSTLSWSDASGARTARIATRARLGSAEHNDIVVADPKVSRLHAELELRSDGLWIRDVGSRNGTWVGGVLVQAARIGAGQAVVVGDTTISASYHDVALPTDAWSEPQYGPLVGPSVVMRILFATLARVAATDSSILLQGESGTGKELVAQAIHEESPRVAGPFVVVDCGAIPETLFDSELFGHTKGAFTGANATHIGALESANGGTVFLDEIGELPLAVQPKLLRALESRTIRRVGETAHRDIDVRFVSATHRDLLQMVNAGQFREDLYFRLSVIPVIIPPLRERATDIPALVGRFVPPAQRNVIGPDVMQELLRQPWRGNVRELRNFVERAMALGSARALAMMTGTAEAAPESVGVRPSASAIDFDQPFTRFREQWRDSGDRKYLEHLLAAHENVAEAAKVAGVDRTYIYRLTRRLGL